MGSTASIDGVPDRPADQDDEHPVTVATVPHATTSTVPDYLPGPSSTLSEWHRRCDSRGFDIFGALMNVNNVFCFLV